MSEHRQDIQWFPGHMTKTLRSMEAEMKNVDFVIELLDARIPKSSKNPELARLSAGKPLILLLNKADLADPAVTKRWIAEFRTAGHIAAAIDGRGKDAGSVLTDAVHRVIGERMERRKERGQTGYKPRAMISGVPNVGKSTFINNIAGKSAAAVADRPGVTRGKQWISAGNFDLLDMPGVLWPKFESKKTAEKLAFTGAIRDDILAMTELAAGLLRELKITGCAALQKRYRVEYEPDIGDYDLLALIAKKRGMLLQKGEYDLERAAVMLLDELRGKKLGRISLERPEDF